MVKLLYFARLREDLGTSAQEVALALQPSPKGWMETPADFRPVTWCYSAAAKNLKALELPNPREWQPSDADWKLPENWKEIILQGMEERLNRFRSFRLFMDICVRCGACADKCHFFIGSGDPKNMPVLRAELLRSVYRRYFTRSGRLLGKLAGARDYYQRKERSVFLDILRQEQRDGRRVVFENAGFLAFCPFAARFPFELCLLPKRQTADYHAIEPGEILQLAEALKTTLSPGGSAGAPLRFGNSVRESD